jgi:hypothetical protein
VSNILNPVMLVAQRCLSLTKVVAASMCRAASVA